MKLPNKIGIIDSTQSTDTRLRFDAWEGYDSKLQRKYLALKLNEILDFISEHPAIANEFGSLVKQEGDKVIHAHEWRLIQRLGGRAIYDCPTCGDTQERYLPPNLA